MPRLIKTLGSLLVVVLAAACGSETPPPSPTPSPQITLRPLPANIAGIPGPADPTAIVEPHTPPGELEVGVTRNLPLGHCGLGSPLDFDGSLWDPIAGHDGFGGPLTEDQIGELINATPVVVTLLEPGIAEIRTPRGAVITLHRHDGPRAYFLCR